MNLIIPMAGKGKRLRPHTLSRPKPCFTLADKMVVHHLIDAIAAQSAQPIAHIGFVVGDIDAETRANLTKIAQNYGAEAHFFVQSEALGTAHAVHCARSLLSGPVLIAFADTIFTIDQPIKIDQNGIFVQRIPNPEAFGVIIQDAEGKIIDFVEKPQNFVSDLAMIGAYFFADGAPVAKAIARVVDDPQALKSGEYQLPDALRYLVREGMAIAPIVTQHWLDCGNKDALLKANAFLLEQRPEEPQLEHVVLVQPCYIHPTAQVEHAVIGPHVSIGPRAKVTNSCIKNSIIGARTLVDQAILTDTILGEDVQWCPKATVANVGDFTQYHG